MKQAILAASLVALLLAACDNANEQSQAEPPATTGPSESGSDPSTRASDALKDAGNSALDAAAKLGEAGKAGLEALQQEAPAVTETLSQAAESAKQAAGEVGERLQSATDALLNDPDSPPLDSAGDSQNDANQTPEAQEPPR